MAAPEENNLKTCPFCSSFQTVPVIEQHKEGNRFFVQCANANCGACSGFSDTKEEAKETWNKRAGDDCE